MLIKKSTKSRTEQKKMNVKVKLILQYVSQTISPLSYNCGVSSAVADLLFVSWLI
jgi:hypothetical protein